MSMGNIAYEIQKGISMLEASATWDPASIADGDMEAVDITVAKAVLGDYVIATSFSLDVQDLQLTADITAAGVVTAVLSNSTGAGVNLASGTIRIIVMQRK